MLTAPKKSQYIKKNAKTLSEPQKNQPDTGLKNQYQTDISIRQRK